MSTAPLLLREDSLRNASQIAIDLINQIQEEIGDNYNIDYKFDANMGAITGSPDDLEYRLDYSFSENGTIIPGTPAVPSYTITPAVPSYTITPRQTITPRVCVWGVCTPAVVAPPVMSPPVPAVMSPPIPAFPATTGSVSGTLVTSVEVKGLSEALKPMIEGTVFGNTSMHSPGGLANQDVIFSTDGIVKAADLGIYLYAGWENLKVTVAGVTTNLGSVSIPIGTVDPQKGEVNTGINFPNVSGSFDTVINFPSYNDPESKNIRINDLYNVIYELFPQSDRIEINNVLIDPTESIIATGLDATFDALNDYWDTYVCGVFNAVDLGSYCLPSPTGPIIDAINNSVANADDTIGTQISLGINEDLTSTLSDFLPYTQAVAALTWNYGEYPIFPNSNYVSAILAGGKFSGVDASGSDFSNADMQESDFSNANLNDATFTGANLTGANFAGASGGPISSPSNRSARLRRTDSEEPFKDAVLFGADLRNTKNLNFKGSFIDSKTLTDTGLSLDRLIQIKPYSFILQNKLVKKYAHNPMQTLHDIGHDVNHKGAKGEEGLKTKILNNEYSYNQFDDERFYKSLPPSLKEKVDSYRAEDRDEFIAKTIFDYRTENKTIIGNSSSERLIGNFGSNMIKGKQGDDIIKARYGHDTIDGGRGDDTILPGRGIDKIKLSRGNDIILGFKIKERDSIDATSAKFVQIAKDGKNIHITTNQGSIILKNVNYKSFSELLGKDNHFETSSGSAYHPLLTTVGIDYQ